MNEPLLTRIDHLVYATTDLEKSVADLEARLGVRPAPGGQHPGRGTHNALIALSDRSYLEVIGPDPTQAKTADPRWFQIDGLEAPRLVTWAVKEAELDALRAKAKACGICLGPVVSGTRQRSDGSWLRWRFTDPATVVADGIVPFFIDWGDSPHPAASAPPGPVLKSLRAEHPEPTKVMRALSAVGIKLPVESGPRPALIATLRTERGLVELR
ncbi:MAG: VOC family protein [Desulfobacterales bacterium]